MKLGCLTLMFANGGMDLEKTLKYLKPFGMQCVEFATGGVLGDRHAHPAEFLADPTRLRSFQESIKRHGLEISNLSVHCNQLHPNPDTFARYHRDLELTILLAEKLGVRCIATFSGCPGESPQGRYPNWVLTPAPDDFRIVLDYQWNEVAIPYWTKMTRFAREHGVDRIGIEMYPGNIVYNPETLLRLRAAVGPVLGSCFDPSHIMWQGIHAPSAVTALGDAIFHVHAKDSWVNPDIARVNGVLDTKPYHDAARRSWLYRVVGFGHDTHYWKQVFSALSTIGYKETISIERDDCLMSPVEGFEKSVAFLKETMIFDQTKREWHGH